MSASATLRRLERVLTMVPWVLDHPGVTLDDLAARFGGTPREILADLDVLGYCGLPGYGGGDLIEVRVLGDRVSVHLADYFRRPLRLTVREAVTLLLAARAFAQALDAGESGPLAAAAAKLEALLGSDSEHPPAVALELSSPAPESLADLRAAVDAGRVVRLVYRSESKAETTTREVEPWRLAASGGHWYLQGWCRLADGPRDFRLDRVREHEVTGEVVATPEAAPSPPIYRPGPEHTEVVLEVAPQGRWVVDWIVADRVEPRDGGLRIAFRAATLDWAARLVLRLAGHARVLEPPDLAARVADLAAGALAAYEHD